MNPKHSSKKEKNRKSASVLKTLGKELGRLRVEDEKLYRQVLSLAVRSGAVRFAEYINKEKEGGLVIAKNAAIWIDDTKPKNFRNRGKLEASFSPHWETLGEAWFGKWQWIKGGDEYLGIIRKIIASPRSKKLMWAAPGLFKMRPRLAYLYKNEDRKPIIVVIDQDGFIENVGVGTSWRRIALLADGFFKIDDFEDKDFHPL